MTPREKNFYDFPEKKISSRKLKLADKIVRKILNLNTSTPIEDYTEKSQKNRSIIEKILINNHIRISILI